MLGVEHVFSSKAQEAGMARQTRPTDEAPKRTPSFVCEMPLRVSPAQERTLLARLDAARQAYTPAWDRPADARSWCVNPKPSSMPEHWPATIPPARRAFARREPSTTSRNTR